MSPSPSSRAAFVKPFIVMDMFREANALAAGGHDVVHMSAGQPAGGPPQKVVEAAREALDGAYMGYTDSLGLPALARAHRAALSRRLRYCSRPWQGGRHNRFIRVIRAEFSRLF